VDAFLRKKSQNAAETEGRGKPKNLTFDRRHPIPADSYALAGETVQVKPWGSSWNQCQAAFQVTQSEDRSPCKKSPVECGKLPDGRASRDLAWRDMHKSWGSCGAGATRKTPYQFFANCQKLKAPVAI
jgi:hypothetical protein